MTAHDPYDVAATAQTRRGVRQYEGVETVTRLPVRIYRFHGSPRGDLSRLESACLPGILGVEEGEAGQDSRMVVVLPREYVPLADPGEVRSAGTAPLGPVAAARAVEGLRAAHEAGVVHGDVGPHRLWIAGGDDLLLEGAGVPWSRLEDPEGFEKDVRALAGTLLEYGPDLPRAVRELLRSVSTGARAAPRSAADLARALEALGVHVPGPKEEEGAAAPPRPNVAPAAGAPEGAPASRRVGPAVGPDGTPPRVVKDVPPGSVYRPGLPGRDDDRATPHPPSRAEDPRGARRELPWTLLGLLGAAVLVAAASLLGQDQTEAVPGTGTGPGVAHVVGVRVDPPDAPPLEIAVVDSPGGSSLDPGTRLGRAPRRIVLDSEGRWVIRGSFGERTSDEVAFHVPEDVSVVLTLRPSAPTPP